MRACQTEKRTHGWFFRNDQQFLALLQVTQAPKLAATEVTDSTSRGEFEIKGISGCKPVALEGIYRFIDKREDLK